MRAKTLLASFGLAATVGVALVTTQTPPPPTVEGLVSAAKASAGLDWPGTFLRLCVVPPPVVRRGGDAPASASAAVTGPPKNTWFAEPAKVADNLYFLGTKVHNSWALVGSDGIVIIEALFDYASPDEVIDGMRKLHLDTNKVKYVVMSHAHGDHDGGARFLQDKLSSGRLIYGAPDWDLAASQTRPGGAPKRDMDGTDGMVLSVGDTSIRIVTTPGHTAGTLSYLFEARDNGRPLRFVYVGGTAIPFDEKSAWYDEYVASSRKLAKAAADFGATALISNHTEFDNGYYKAHTAAHRQPGEANPFEVGKDTVARYFTLVDQCATAAKLRASSAAR